jgi:hypothetical protein
MPPRVRLVTLVSALIALAAATGAQGSRTAEPSLTLNINLSGSLEAVLGNGTRIRTATAPGTVIPPGPYLLIVKSDVPDDKDIFHVFHISGPGLDQSSDLLPCENPRELLIVTLRPNSTYVYEDSRHPELSRVVFSTSSGGSSAETSSSAGGHTAKYSGSVSNSSGFGTNAVRGTLVGTVAPTGKLTLRKNGKAVSLLKSGRYRIAVDDRTSKHGLTVERPNRDLVTVTGPSFVGKRTVTLNLRPGQWLFLSGGTRQPLTVVS